MTRSVRVVKVGGSLLDLESFPERVGQWLQQQSSAAQVLVAGGGQLADVVRQADALHRIGDEFGHWLCVSLMEITARLLARLLPGSQLIEDYNALAAVLDDDLSCSKAAKRDQCNRSIVFAVESYLREHEPIHPGAKATHDWRTTSDAIAARLAVSIGAEELVLLKSTALPPGTSRIDAAKRGLVDERFPSVSESLTVRWVDLRGNDRAEARL